MAKVRTEVTATADLDFMVQAALRGDSPTEIARDPRFNGKYSAYQVRTALRRLAHRIKERLHDLVASRFVAQDELLRRLVALWSKDLILSGFDRDKANALLKALDRQARLLGLDKGSSNDLPVDEWIGRQTDEQLVATFATKHGIRIPADIMEPSRN